METRQGEYPNPPLRKGQADQLQAAVDHLADCIDAYLPREDGQDPTRCIRPDEPWHFGMHLAFNAAVAVERILNPAKLSYPDPNRAPSIDGLNEYIPFWYLRGLLDRLYDLYSWQEISHKQEWSEFNLFSGDDRREAPVVPGAMTASLRLFGKLIAGDKPEVPDEPLPSNDPAEWETFTRQEVARHIGLEKASVADWDFGLATVERHQGRKPKQYYWPNIVAELERQGYGAYTKTRPKKIPGE